MAITLVVATGKALGPTGGTTVAIDTTGASLLVVSMGSSATLTGITDSKSNTWTGLTQASTLGTYQRIFYVVSPTVGTGHTFTSTANFSTMVVFAFAGTGSVDGPQNGGTGGASPLSAGSVTPTLNGALVYTSLGASGTTMGTITGPSGFTTGTVIPGGAGNNMYGVGAYLIQTTAGAVTPAWTWTGSTTDAATVVAVFRPASGGGGGGSTQTVLLLV